MGTILTNLLTKLAHNVASLLVALFLIGGLSSVAEHYNLPAVQSSLSSLKGILITESNTTVVTSPSTTVVVSGTVVSGTSPTTAQ